MDTIAVTLSVPSFDQDAALAALPLDGLNGVLQEDDRLVLYVAANAWTDAQEANLRTWLREHGYTEDDLHVRAEPARNWNAAWEETLAPISAGRFVIQPSTAPTLEAPDATPIVIDPEMSFGTGHHASTRLALTLLPDAVSSDNHVLDVGTGTGVLAIAACHCGAASVIGVDTHPPAVENARVNAARNDYADRITIRAGTLDDVAADSFDAVLANITREVLRSMLPGFAQRVAAGGALVLAGLFTSDRDVLCREAAAHGFSLVDERDEDGWWAARFRAQEVSASS